MSSVIKEPWFPHFSPLSGGDSLRRAAKVSASVARLSATEQFGAGTEPRGPGNNGVKMGYPLVNIQKLLKMAIYSEFSH